MPFLCMQNFDNLKIIFINIEEKKSNLVQKEAKIILQIKENIHMYGEKFYKILRD